MHFWHGGEMPESQATALIYCADTPYGCPLQSSRNVLTGNIKLFFAETVFDMASLPGQSGRRPLLRPEQKPFFANELSSPEIYERL